jgi:hypothetical protein
LTDKSPPDSESAAPSRCETDKRANPVHCHLRTVSGFPTRSESRPPRTIDWRKSRTAGPHCEAVAEGSCAAAPQLFAGTGADTVRDRARRRFKRSPSFATMQRLAIGARGPLRCATQASLTVSFMTPGDPTTLITTVRENPDARHRSREARHCEALEQRPGLKDRSIGSRRSSAPCTAVQALNSYEFGCCQSSQNEHAK